MKTRGERLAAFSETKGVRNGCWVARHGVSCSEGDSGLSSGLCLGQRLVCRLRGPTALSSCSRALLGSTCVQRLQRLTWYVCPRSLGSDRVSGPALAGLRTAQIPLPDPRSERAWAICLFLLLFPVFWAVGHRGSCCDVCRRVFCLCSPLGVL